MEWSEGSDRLSGERERLLRCLSCDRLEWSDAREWISEMSEIIKQEPRFKQSHWKYTRTSLISSYTLLTISVRGVG